MSEIKEYEKTETNAKNKKVKKEKTNRQTVK